MLSLLYLVLAIAFALAVKQAFKIIDLPNFNGQFQAIHDKKSSLKVFVTVFFATYILRVLMISLYGSWYFLIVRYFWRWELYLFISLVTDAPGLFLLYIKHIRSLDDSDAAQMAFAQDGESFKDVVVLLTDVDTDFISEYRPNRASAYSVATSMYFSKADSVYVDPDKFEGRPKSIVNTSLNSQQTRQLYLEDD